MLRWSPKDGNRVESPRVDAFLTEIEAVCRRHNMSIGHEDGHGSFIVYQKFSEMIAEWMRGASVEEEPI